MTTLTVHEYKVPSIKVIGNFVIYFNVNFKEGNEYQHKGIYALAYLPKDNNITNKDILHSDNLRVITKIGRYLNTFCELEGINDSNYKSPDCIKQLKTVISLFLKETGLLSKTNWRY